MTVCDFVKSSYSSSKLECVEVAINVPGTVAIRDSKSPFGPTIHVSPAAWAAFQEVIAHGSAT
ncbi:DUF397 domain-containing protein [Streptomyces sp. NPDC050617]|uniref:DUF397 domain-containing protein n=1 Tax=Streptomyces sp. NPDC050617 TaxID=3154628 RepID=UPI0034472DA6